VAALAECLDLSGIGDGGRAALDGHGPPVHENLPSSTAAGHDRVIDLVAELGQHLSAGRKYRCDSHDLILTMRRLAAVNGLESDALGREAQGSRGLDGKLDLELQSVLSLLGFSLGIP